jgi:prevent-host-death family protein
MMDTVGAFEAKTHLSELLERVAHGETIQITKRGRLVALLTPPTSAQTPDLKRIVAEMREFRKGRKLGRISLRTLIEEGRRY